VEEGTFTRPRGSRDPRPATCDPQGPHRCGRARVLFTVPNARVLQRNIQRYQIAVYPSGHPTSASGATSGRRRGRGRGDCVALRIRQYGRYGISPSICPRRACRIRELDYPTTRAGGAESPTTVLRLPRPAAPSPTLSPTSKHEGYLSPHAAIIAAVLPEEAKFTTKYTNYRSRGGYACCTPGRGCAEGSGRAAGPSLQRQMSISCAATRTKWAFGGNGHIVRELYVPGGRRGAAPVTLRFRS
jgi:hypothetical protein